MRQEQGVYKLSRAPASPVRVRLLADEPNSVESEARFGASAIRRFDPRGTIRARLVLVDSAPAPRSPANMLIPLHLFELDILFAAGVANMAHIRRLPKTMAPPAD